MFLPTGATTMSKIVSTALIAMLAVIVWLAFKAKYKARHGKQRLLWLWRNDPRAKETAIFSTALIVSLMVFTIFPGS